MEVGQYFPVPGGWISVARVVVIRLLSLLARLSLREGFCSFGIKS